MSSSNAPSPSSRRNLLPALAAAALSLSLESGARAENWPAWRGPTGLGTSAEIHLPLRWGPGENVKWKVPLPGPGNSTPVVWGKRVFVTQAVEGGKKRMLLCFDRGQGQLLWKKEVEHLEAEPTHGDNPYCSASPSTDGERVIVSHGSAGVFAYGMEGAELWRRDLGRFHHVWGNASSPVLWEDLCFLNCGPGERTFLTALEKRTGKTVWKVDIAGGREGGDASTWTGSWSTPLFIQNGRSSGKGLELLVSYPGRLRSFDPRTGSEVWSCEGLGRLVYTSPIAAEGVVVAMSGFMGPPMAVRLSGEGDVTATHRLWREEKAQQRIGSGVISGGHIYILNDGGVAECLDLKTGKPVWRERLGHTWGSALLADGKIYFPADSGDCFVVRPSTSYELLAKNSLGERMRASIAVSDGDFFIRTYQHLWCIGERR